MSYQSHADLGGRSSPDRVVPEPEGELFHAGWEPRALALTLAMGATGAWNIDMSRAARETLPDYANLSYYQVWIAGLMRLLDERRLLDPGPALLPRVLNARDVASVLARGSPTLRPTTQAARFAVGDRVRTLNAPAPHHTRLPAYARGATGRIERLHGMHVFADRHAQGQGEQPQWLYTVVFDAAALWPGETDANQQVSIDAWEPYLDAA